MTEKYLYFAKNTARSLALTASESNVQTYTLTTSLVDPIPDGVANTNHLFVNGAVTAEMQNLHLTSSTAAGIVPGSAATDDDHVLGSAYILAGKNIDDGKLTVHPSALSFDGSNLVTVSTVAQDGVYGITNSSTVGENDITFTANVPMVAGDAAVWPASAFLGMEMVSSTVCDVYFEGQQNDGVGNGVDRVRITYAADKFKVFSQLMHDVISDSRNQGEMIVIADTFRGIYHSGNPAGITSTGVTAIALDT